MIMSKEDYIARIAVATPLQLVIINYELFLDEVEIAINNVDEHNREIFDNAAEKSRAFLKELVVALNMSADVSENLLQLYLYVNKLIVDAFRKKSEFPLIEAKKIMTAILSSWKHLEKEGCGNNGFNNQQQKLYTGFTYDKNGEMIEYAPENEKRGYEA